VPRGPDGERVPFSWVSDRQGILIADGDVRRRSWLAGVLADMSGVVEAHTLRDALTDLRERRPRLLFVSSQLGDATGAELLTQAGAAGLLPPGGYHLVIFELAGAAPGQAAPRGAPALDADALGVRIYYRVTPALEGARVRELIAEAIRDRRSARPQGDPAQNRRLLDRISQLAAERDPDAAAALATDAIFGLCAVERARVLYVDAEGGTMWDGAHPSADGATVAAARGVAGFVARTGRPVMLAAGADDPRFDLAVDNPGGGGRDRVLVCPVLGTDGTVHALLLASRGPGRPPFARHDEDIVMALAKGWAPFLQQLALESEAAAAATDGDDGAGEIFRHEAVMNLVRRGSRGDVVRVHPGWLRAAYWMVLATVAAALVFTALARIHRYSAGTAVLRAIGRDELVADDDGTVAGLQARPGQRVRRGEVIARIHDPARARELRELELTFERNLVAYLLDPANASSRSALAAVVLQRESALSGAEARAIRAPYDGVLKELLVRNGQRIAAGKTIATVSPEGAEEGLALIAFLPGGDRPALEVGQRVRFTLPGYRDASFESTVELVSADVMAGEDAVIQYVGDRFVGAVPAEGQVVVVRAQLGAASFVVDGTRYDLHDGMTGLAEVRLDSQSILASLAPGGS
jgi:biotin carboxyl carrier protein